MTKLTKKDVRCSTCSNLKSEGEFVGKFCSPCFQRKLARAIMSVFEEARW